MLQQQQSMQNHSREIQNFMNLQEVLKPMMQLLIISLMFWLSILSLISSNTSISQKAINKDPT